MAIQGLTFRNKKHWCQLAAALLDLVISKSISIGEKTWKRSHHLKSHNVKLFTLVNEGQNKEQHAIERLEHTILQTNLPTGVQRTDYDDKYDSIDDDDDDDDESEESTRTM